MLMPKRVKHRKQFRGSMSGKATRGNTITYGAVSYTHLDVYKRQEHVLHHLRVDGHSGS